MIGIGQANANEICQGYAVSRAGIGRRPARARRFALALGLTLLALGVGFAGPAAAQSAAAAGSVDPTWQRARVAIPSGGGLERAVFGDWRDPVVQRAVAKLAPESPLPAVIYLHGCSGIGPEGEAVRVLLMEWGFAVFQPNSFARPARRANCSASSQITALAPEAHEFRQQELENSLTQVRALDWIDPARIFVMGFSEGGMALAGYGGGDLAGAIITGWHCAGRGRFAGLSLGPGVPVLAILGAADPWYQHKQGRHCGEYFSGRAGPARSLVLAGNGHEIVNSPDIANAERAKAAIIAFLGGGG